MRKVLTAFFCGLLLFPLLAVAQQDGSSATTGKTAEADSSAKKKRAPVFRANKAQITQAQELLKQKGHYTGEITGKLDDDTRGALKKYQGAEGLKVTGTLNPDTLNKMGIPLAMPAGKADDGEMKGKKPRAPVFRANKEQIRKAQEILRQRGFYTGETEDKLSDDIRAGLKKYQSAEGLKATGTLNAPTLEKMGIPLTDKQKENLEKAKAMKAAGSN